MFFFNELSFFWFPVVLHFLLKNLVPLWRFEMSGLIHAVLIRSFVGRSWVAKRMVLVNGARFLLSNLLLIGGVGFVYSVCREVSFFGFFSFPSFWWALIVFVFLFFLKKIVRVRIDFFDYNRKHL